jgi:hypothetical protein
MILRARFSSLAALFLVSAVLSGCSASEAASAPTPAPPAEAQAEEAGCAEVPAAVRKHLDSGDVDTVVVVGQCTSVEVRTRLADGDVAGARKLCDRAGEVAYVGDINGVTVLSGSGEELSAGITGARCLP